MQGSKRSRRSQRHLMWSVYKWNKTWRRLCNKRNRQISVYGELPSGNYYKKGSLDFYDLEWW